MDKSQETALILCVGTEVAWGETVNTNASWLAQSLLPLSIRPTQTMTVEDDPALIKAVLQLASRQVDWVVCTGGLGPTDDDLTLAALADWLATPLIPDPAILQGLKDSFERLNRPWAESNAKQALVPQGARALENPAGTAPGIVWPVAHLPEANRVKGIIAVPGVPREMKALWPAMVDWLATQRPLAALPDQPLRVDLWFFGLGESLLAEQMHAQLREFYPAIEAATYVGQGMVRVRLSTALLEQSDNMATARNRLIDHFTPYFIGEGERVTVEQWVSQHLIAIGQTLAVAESCTGGLVSSRLTDIPGSSAYTMANVTTYSNAAKSNVLGVPADLIQTHGAVSEPVAAAMACGVRQRMGTDWGLSLTGIAGPDGGSESKPVGTVCIGVATRHQPDGAWIRTFRIKPGLSRVETKALFASHGLYGIKLALMGEGALRAQGFTFLYN